MKTITFILMLLSCTSIMFAQDHNYQSKITINPAVGAIIPIKKLFKGDASDALIGYKDLNFYWQALSGSLYFNRRFGIQFDAQIAFVDKVNINAPKFQEQVREQFGVDRFFVAGSGGEVWYANMKSVARVMLGGVYRYETTRWFLNPRLSVGVSTFDIQNASVVLKEKDSHEFYTVSYKRSNVATNSFTVLAGISTGYKLRPRLYLNVDLSGSYFRPNLTINEDVRQASNGEMSSRTVDYKRSIVSINAAAGVIIVLQKFKEFRSE
ncbi:hypothetical protein [Pseudochryseolinea flava]|uniref:Outer membrane protein beta-barrel domain-containing protein n=1 Tax=Pseudochryseolinea flava TaxID=2059302 RepID=A0A364Y158_9BACT|nr:hypothetical protein [Pseudochryseolinea flava]RAW00348.1 hypothetical protein DQQ10_14945 [Pseudochryseolinea flava]